MSKNVKCLVLMLAVLVIFWVPGTLAGPIERPMGESGLIEQPMGQNESIEQPMNGNRPIEQSM